MSETRREIPLDTTRLDPSCPSCGARYNAEQRIKELKAHIIATDKHQTAEEPGDLCFNEVTGLHAEADLYRITELEARIELALRMPAFCVGYVDDALKGRKLEDMPEVVQACLKSQGEQE